jgi:acyl-CoA thioester hydrolase
VAGRLDSSLADRASYRFWTPVSLRFRDLDLLGHVNNVNLAGWLEDARANLELPIQPMTAGYNGPVIVLVDLHIQYLAEIRWGAEVAVGTRVLRLGTTSVTLGQAVFAGDECAAIAEIVEVLIGPTSRKPEPWPPAFRELFEQYLPAGGATTR